MTNSEAASRGKGSVAAQLTVGIVLALLVGGTSPWWWKEVFREPERPPENPTPRLTRVSQGQEILPGSFTLDLDSGAVGGDVSAADLHWSLRSEESRHLTTLNGAALHRVGSGDLDGVSESDLLSAPYSPAALNGSPNAANQIPAGTVVLVKTTKGRFSKVRIENNGIAAPGDLPSWPRTALLIRWETYATN